MPKLVMVKWRASGGRGRDFEGCHSGDIAGWKSENGRRLIIYIAYKDQAKCTKSLRELSGCSKEFIFLNDSSSAGGVLYSHFLSSHPKYLSGHLRV